ncbi:MAG: hypothetical protein ACI4DS_01395 [Eubacterium sp.]
MATTKTRKRSHRRVNYRKIIVPVEIIIILAVIISVICLFSCGKSKDAISVSAGESGIYISTDSRVTYKIAENFDKSYYSEDDLKKQIESEVEDFNSSSYAGSDNAMSLQKYKVKNKVATVEFEFATTEDFVNYVINYNETSEDSIYIGNIKGADEKKFSISGEFNNFDASESIEADKLAESDYNIIILNEKMIISIGNGIKYASENVTFDDEKTVVTPEDEISYIIY